MKILSDLQILLKLIPYALVFKKLLNIQAKKVEDSGFGKREPQPRMTIYRYNTEIIIYKFRNNQSMLKALGGSSGKMKMIGYVMLLIIWKMS